MHAFIHLPAFLSTVGTHTIIIYCTLVFLLAPQNPRLCVLTYSLSSLTFLLARHYLFTHSTGRVPFRTVQEELAQVDKILLYAPPTDQGASIMEALLQELGLSMSSSSSSSSSSVNQPPQQKQHQRMWTLRPMMAADNLLASHLGSQLTQALIETRKQYPSFYPSEQQQQQQQQKSSVIFLGMDSPELPLDEIVAALSSTNELHHHYAHLCPAADGGYGMLSIPAHAPADLVFRGVKWSDPLTAVSQIKALTDIDSVSVRLGRCMHDIDEKQDVKALCERLRLRQGEEAVMEVPATMPTDAFATRNDTNDGDITDCLQVQSASAAAVTGGRPQTGSCRFTRKALMQLGQL